MQSTDPDTTSTPAADSADVFVSYSRRDLAFVRHLGSALEEKGWSVWLDETDIPATAEWRDELATGIRAAHTFLFVLTPDSVASEYCLWELSQAVALGKRLIPVLVRPVEAAPAALAERQYVFMRQEDDFESSLSTLVQALETDLEWVKEHRQWLLAAMRWDGQGRDRSRLVRGRDLKAAEAWLARQAERTEPRPTKLQSEFLLASRTWQTRRVQFVAGGVVVALAVSSALGVVALLQRNDARNQAAISTSRELALSSISQLSVDPERSMLLAKEAVDTAPTAEADNALRRAVLTSRLRTAVPLQATRIGGLINAVAFSPDGKYIAGALKNGTVSVASATAPPGTRATVLPLAPLTADDPCSTFVSAAGHVAVAFSPDSRHVAAVNEVGWIHVWSWPTVWRPITSPFCLGRTARPDALDVLKGITDTPQQPMALAFVDNGTIALVQADGRVLRWSWQNGAKPAADGRSREGILAAAFSKAADATAVADEAGISLTVPSHHRPARLPTRDVYALAVSADGRTVAGTSRRQVVVWAPSTSARPVVLRTPAVVRAVATSRNGSFVAAGDVGRAVHVWDLSRGGQEVLLNGSQGPVSAVAFSPDGQRLLTGGDDGVLRVWDWDAGDPPSVAGAARRATRFQLTRDGRLLAFDPENARAAWVSAAGGLRRLDGVRQPADVAVSRDGRRAVAPVEPLESGKVQLWDLNEGPQPATTVVPGRVTDAAISPDGRWLAFAGRRLLVSTWPGRTPRDYGPRQLVHYSTATFAPGSRRLAAAAFDGKSTTVFVWDVGGPADTTPVHRLPALGFSTSLTFSRDGRRLLTTQTDGGVYIWDLDNPQVPTVLRGHVDGANAAAFSPDGSEVVSGGGDGTVMVWRMGRTPTSVSIPSGTGHILSVAFTPNGRGFIAVGTQGSRIWACDFCGSTDDVVGVAQERATRSLTPDERALFLHDR